MMTTEIRIRPALAHEGLALAKVAAAAFLDDPFDSYMYPARKEHYRSYQRIYQQKIDSHINQSLCWVMVADVTTQVRDKDGNISYEGAAPAAYAIWTRESARKRKDTQRRLEVLGLRDPTAGVSLTQRFKKRILRCGLIEALRERSNPTLLVDKKRFGAFWGGLGDNSSIDDDYDDAAGLTASDSEWERDEYWHLQDLAVAPEFRRRGAAKALLKWGQGWARLENVPILLESTPMGKPLYEGAGFQQHGTWEWGDKPDMAWHMMRWHPSVAT
ncbi:hypothetical protein DHEL01_v209184 [Diaporthe helianthi]|uniref:N-acetyltransferase domain-containing protein n=1 Tax=Diaporthe helianthi TaxID=158607 RepID=A0A2P5HQB9_DIAHE|nr:hypothetical protein DHEL01_v209184 [Diaporthe helianthi]